MAKAFKYVGNGILKKRVEVELDLDKEYEDIVNSLILKCKGYIENMLNQEAKSRGYDNIVTACSYAAIENLYQEESIKLFKWRSDCWTALFDYQNSLKSKRNNVMTLEEVIKKYIPTFDKY